MIDSRSHSAHPFERSLARRGEHCYARIGAVLFVMLIAAIAAHAQRRDPLTAFRFIENRGQWSARACFMLDRGLMHVWMARDEVVYALNDGNGREHILRQRFAGALASTPIAAGEQEGRWSFDLGERGARDVRAFNEVRYRELYRGVDARYYESGGALKYDLLVAPGGDPSSIRFTYAGADDLAIAADGSLAIATSVGVMREGRPLCYQIVDGARRTVACRFTRDGRGIGFALGSYDRGLPLVIDPTLIYSSYLGGGRSDAGRAIALDASGDIYVTGTTLSEDFPLGTGSAPLMPTTAIFIVKLDPTGSSLLGARLIDGDGADDPAAIRIRRDGSVVIAGTTFSTNFPVIAGAYQRNPDASRKGDGFVFGMSGDLRDPLFSTYYGGSDSDRVEDMVLDDGDSIFITGWTRSPDLPMKHALQQTISGGVDAFAAELTPSCNDLEAATYLGGTGDDRASAIATEPGGAVWITGSSTSALFLPAVVNGSAFGPLGLRNCFVTRLWFDGSGGNYKMMIGGDGDDDPRAIAVIDGPDTRDTVIIAGRTTSADYPVTSASAAGSWFVTKLNGTSGTLAFSETFSEPGDNGGASSVVIDADRNLYLSGSTTSPLFPATVAGIGPRGLSDLGFLRLDPTGTLLDGMVVGGGGNDQAAHQSALSSLNDLYITGVTSSANLPLGRVPFDSVLNRAGRTDSTDAFVMRLAFKNHPAISGRASHTFDTLRCDTTELDTFFIFNTGNADLVVNRNFVGAPFQLIQPNPLGVVPDTVHPGGSLRYVLRFSSQAVRAATDTLFIYSNDPVLGNTPFKIALSAVRAVPSLNIDPPSLNFGAVLLCQQPGLRRSVRLANGGISSETIASVTLAHPEPSFQLTPSTVPPAFLGIGAGINLSVLFRPQRVGAINDTIVIRMRECDTIFRIPISGIGDTASLAFPVAELAFGVLPPCVSADDSIVTLTNRGAATLHLVPDQLPVITPDFTRITSLPDSIKPGETIAIKIGFQPLGPGVASATLRVRFVECGIEADLPLRGERIASGTLAANPGAIYFGALQGCAGLPVSADRAITLRNLSNAPITVSFDMPGGAFTLADTGASRAISGGDSMRFTVRYTPIAVGADSAVLLIPFVAGPCSDTLRVVLNGSREEIRLDAPVTVVDFAPLVACKRGADTTLIFINHSSSAITIDRIDTSQGASHVEPLGLPRAIAPGDTFTVKVAFVPVATGAAVEHIIYHLEPCNDSITITLRGAKEGVAYSFREDHLDFPPRLACIANAALDSFLLRNSGNDGAITIRSITVTGSPELSADASAVGRAIIAGDSLYLPIRLTPGVAGSYSGMLELVLDPCGDTLRRPITARLLAPALDVTGGIFGDVKVGESKSVSVVIRNTNPDTVRLDALNGAAPPFTLDGSSLPATLAPGDSIAIDVTFAPSDTLLYAPTLEASVSAPCAFTAAAPLSGHGIPSGAAPTIFCLDTLIPAVVGDTIELVIGAITPAHALASPNDIAYWIGYDPARLALLGAEPAPRARIVSGASTPGVARIEERGATSVGPHEIRLRFLVLLGREPITTVTLDSARMLLAGGEPLAVCDRAATVTISDHCVITSLFRGKFPNRLDDIVPNPSGESVEITYQQLEDARAVLRIFDMQGREVLRPLDATLPGGRYTVRFDVGDLPAGAYLYTLEAGSYRASKKMEIER